MKINSEQDVLCPLIESECSEKETAVPRHRQNMGQMQPKIRFYNFEKTQTLIYPLFRFIVFYDEKNKLLRYVYETKSIVNCHNVETTHYDNTIFEVAMLLGKNVGIDDLWRLGIALAIERKFDIRNCQICCHFNYCQIYWQYVDERTGEQRVVKYYNRQIKNLDRFVQAYRCEKFRFDWYAFRDEIYRFRKYPYWVWEKKDEE